MPGQYTNGYDIADRITALSEEINLIEKRWMEQLHFLNDVVSKSENPLTLMKGIEEVFEMQRDAEQLQVEKMAVMIEKIMLASK